MILRICLLLLFAATISCSDINNDGIHNKETHEENLKRKQDSLNKDSIDRKLKK